MHAFSSRTFMTRGVDVAAMSRRDGKGEVEELGKVRGMREVRKASEKDEKVRG